MRAYLLALAILSCLGCIGFAIAQDQAYRGPDCTQYLHPDCATSWNNSSDLIADNSRYGGYAVPPAIDDPNDPENPGDN